MLHQSQRAAKWKNENLGNSKLKIGSYGCLLTCLSNLAYTDVLVANEKIKKGNGFSGALIKSPEAAKALGLMYEGKTTTKPKFICVAETSYFAPKNPQHFFIYAPRKTVNQLYDVMLDPLEITPSWKKVKYPIKTYRLFRENKPA